MLEARPGRLQRVTIAAAGAFLVHALIFAGLSQRQVQAPAPSAPPILITLQAPLRQIAPSPTPGQQQGTASSVPRPQAHPADGAPSSAPRDAASAPGTALSAPSAPSTGLVLGCLGRSLERLSPQERRECDRDLARIMEQDDSRSTYELTGPMVETDRRRVTLQRRIDAWKHGPQEGTTGKARNDGPPIAPAPLPTYCGTYDRCR